MLSFFLFILSITAGYIIADWGFQKSMSVGEKIIFAIPLGIVTTSWFIFVLAWLTTLTLALQFVLFAYIVICSLYFFYVKKSSLHNLKIKIKKITRRNIQKNGFLILFFLLWTTLLSHLFFTHMLQEKEYGWFTAGGSYGDLALHSTFIHYFADQEKISLISPIYATELTTYPFMLNFFSAILLKTGITIQIALLLPGLSLALSFIFLTHILIKKCTKKTTPIYFFLPLFLFNGGIGFYYFFIDFLNSNASIFNFIQYSKSYAAIPELEIVWGNIITDILLPQRGMLIGLSIFITSVILKYYYWHSKKMFKLAVIDGVLMGATPFFHVHTFITLCCIQLWFFISAIVFKKNYKYLGLVLLLTLVIAAPQLFWQFSNTFSESFVSQKIGWTMKEGGNLFMYWFSNMGISVLLLFFGLLHLLGSKQNLFTKLFITVLVCIYIPVNLFSFQPNEYDNIKFIIFGYFGGTLAASMLLTDIWNIKKVRLITLAFVMASTATGILTVTKAAFASHLLLNNTEIAQAQEIRQITKPYDIFLTAHNHNHLVTMGAGRPTIMGYPGWLWTHGVDYGQVQNQVRAIYSGRPDADTLITSLGVAYIYVGPNEKKEFNINLKYLETFDTVYQDQYATVYKTQ